jgi:uncharacterized protein (UPF0548 family)
MISMFSLVRPSDDCVQRFLARQQDLPFSYEDVGATVAEPPAGYVRDHNRIQIGVGQQAFEQACAALRNWTMFRLGWIEIHPPKAPLSPGTTVSLLVRVWGVWVPFACRIIRRIEEHGLVERFGFAYGTLPGHLLDGEERFLVEWHREDDSVWYDVLALSRPGGLLGRLAYPLVRQAQRRFAPDSLRAMTREVGRTNS